MSQRLIIKYTVVFLPVLATLVTVGCAGPTVVRPQDQASLSFTCRLPSGELAVTTRMDSDVAGEPKAPIYLPRSGDENVTVTAGPRKVVGAETLRQSFESEVMSRLAAEVVGLKEGEEVSRLLTAERLTGLPENELSTRVARVRKRQKEQKLTIDEYERLTGRKPEVGKRFIVDPLMPGKVVSVTDKEAVIIFSPDKRVGVTTPFGPATIRETADQYEIDIETQPGKLVRSGGLVGRVSAVDNNFITLDFSHPFAGETLNCQLKVVGVTPATTLRADTINPKRSSAPDGSGAAVGNTPEETLDKSFRKHTTAAAGSAAGGDLATVHYTATLADGSVFYTTRQEVADRPDLKKVSWYAPSPRHLTEEVAVGKPALFPGIGEAVVGMAVGEKKRVTLPDSAFGQSDPGKRFQLPLKRTIPRIVVLSAQDYVKRFDGFPTVGKEVDLVPYFPAKVIGVTESDVQIEFLASDGASVNDEFGTTNISVAAENISTTLTPVIGASFPVQSGSGVIIATDGTTFTVDTNHPLAGQSVTIDLELTGVTKAASLPGDLPWQQEHDGALEAAKQAGKPVVLVLYADWCTYCKKLFSETMPDPRITSLRDRFAWIKVNSDKLTDYKMKYSQDGYPMIVLFKADGSIARTLDGYQEAAAFRAVLQDVL